MKKNSMYWNHKLTKEKMFVQNKSRNVHENNKKKWNAKRFVFIIRVFSGSVGHHKSRKFKAIFELLFLFYNFDPIWHFPFYWSFSPFLIFLLFLTNFNHFGSFCPFLNPSKSIKIDCSFQEEKIREEEEAIKRKAEEEAKKKEAMAAMSMNYSGFMAKKQVSFPSPSPINFEQ